MKGSITSHGENTWLIRYYLPGTKDQKSVTFKGSYEDAEFKLADLLQKAKTGFATDPEKITVAELLDMWLAIKSGKVKETCWVEYEKKVASWEMLG